jgi:anti-sigma regulatory factor (Ser/Thr protein kinase)
MEEISLNILDLAQNAISAGAGLISITVDERRAAGTLTVTVSDNGRGMPPQQLENAVDPFYTSRTTRKVGLGLPFFKMAAELTGGSFKITSEEGVGTTVCGVFRLNHIDRMPLGDVKETIISLIYCNPLIDIVFTRFSDLREYSLDTREMHKVLGSLPLNSSEVIAFIRNYLCDCENEIIGGV